MLKLILNNIIEEYKTFAIELNPDVVSYLLNKGYYINKWMLKDEYKTKAFQRVCKNNRLY